jgi:hypothetical protein
MDAILEADDDLDIQLARTRIAAGHVQVQQVKTRLLIGMIEAEGMSVLIDKQRAMR